MPCPDPDLVSVVIPAYNAAATIGATVSSVLRQTHRRLEVLVVDDGSTDDTAALVAARAATDSRLRLLSRRNGGVAAARNQGITAARGAAVAFLDADDLWRPHTIEALFAVLRRDWPRVGLVYCWSALIDGAGSVMPERGCTGWAQGQVLRSLVASNFIGNASAALVHRDCLETVRFDETAFASGAQGAEDWQFYLDMAARWEVALVPRYLVGYRQRPASMSRQAAPLMASHRHVMAQVRRRHPGLEAHLFRWSEANLLLWLAWRAADGDAAWDMARRLLRALWCDPPRALSPTTARLALLAVRCAASRTLRPWHRATSSPPGHRDFLTAEELPPPPAAPPRDWLDRRRARNGGHPWIPQTSAQA